MQDAPAPLNGLTRLADQLPRRLVHAHHRVRLVVGPAVDVEHPLHGRHELPAGLGRYHPADLAPRLEFVFLSVRRTVSDDRLSTYPNSTSRWARSLSVQRACPWGACPQLMAIKRACSALPFLFAQDYFVMFVPDADGRAAQHIANRIR